MIKIAFANAMNGQVQIGLTDEIGRLRVTMITEEQALKLQKDLNGMVLGLAKGLAKEPTDGN